MFSIVVFLFRPIPPAVVRGISGSQSCCQSLQLQSVWTTTSCPHVGSRAELLREAHAETDLSACVTCTNAVAQFQPFFAFSYLDTYNRTHPVCDGNRRSLDRHRFSATERRAPSDNLREEYIFVGCDDFRVCAAARISKVSELGFFLRCFFPFRVVFYWTCPDQLPQPAPCSQHLGCAVTSNRFEIRLVGWLASGKLDMVGW